MTILDLRTISGVELIRVGTWEISTGTWTVTPADLVAAVAAHRAGAVRRPPVKLGHVDPRFDGEPAYGFVDNLRVVDNGQTLVGDLVGLPPMLADLIPVAYADRSVEGVQGFVDASGQAYSFALTGVALLAPRRPVCPRCAPWPTSVSFTGSPPPQPPGSASSGCTPPRPASPIAAVEWLSVPPLPGAVTAERKS